MKLDPGVVLPELVDQPRFVRGELLTGMSRVQPVRHKALLPAADRWSCGSQPLLDQAAGGAIGVQQNQPGAEQITGR